MNTKVLILTTAIFLVTFVSAKPLTEPNSNQSNAPSNIRTLIKRAAANLRLVSGIPAKTDFVLPIIATKRESSKKTRKCEEWELQPFTNKYKCVKLTVISKMG